MGMRSVEAAVLYPSKPSLQEYSEIDPNPLFCSLSGRSSSDTEQTCVSDLNGTKGSVLDLNNW